MGQVHLLGANVSYDTNKQAVEKNQIIQLCGYENDKYVVYDYSLKALALFGDTRPIKDQLKALGGRFNPKLMHEGSKKAGWIFSKSKEQELKNLLTIK